MENYDIFISHSSRRDSKDHELVDKLAKALERRGWKVFLDRNCFQKGQQLLPSLHEAVRSSTVGIIVLTYKAIESGWVEYEFDLMKSQVASGKMYILGLRLESSNKIPTKIRLQNIVDCLDRFDITNIADRISEAINEFNQSKNDDISHSV